VPDVAEIGISAISEIVTSRWALNDPARHAIHLPWIESGAHQHAALALTR